MPSALGTVGGMVNTSLGEMNKWLNHTMFLFFVSFYILIRLNSKDNLVPFEDWFLSIIL